MTESSTELWRRWRSGRDDRAFAELVVPEIARAVAVARGAGCDGSAAEDAVQDALVGLAQERTDAPVEIGVRVWLFRAVRDRARSSLRAARRRRRREETSSRPEATSDSRERTEAAEIVERALANLDPEDREAVRLRCALDLEYEEVAGVLGTSAGAARVRVHRALERLRARLGGDAATMLAALPLPIVLHPESLVAGAIGSAASGAGAGAAAGIATVLPAAGGAALATTKVTVLAAGAAFVVGASLAGIATAPKSNDGAMPGAAEPPPRESATAAVESARPPRRAARSGAAPAAEPAEASAWLADLAPTDDERTWIREALVAERVRRVEAAIRAEDTGVDVLRRYLRHGADVEPVLASYAAARTHVPSPTGESVRFAAPDDGKPVDLAPAVGASILEFGPGRFDLRASRQQFYDRQKSATTLEIRGAGRDETTLVMGRSQEIMLLKESQSVVLRGLTLEFPDADATPIDVRGGASIAFEDVRFSGWLSSAGHSAVLGVSGQGFLACRDCEFLAPGDGFVLSLRGPGLAVFERCKFADSYSVFIAAGAASGGRPSVVRTIDCEFLDTRLADSRIRSGTNDDVDLRVRGGRVSLLGTAASEAERRRAWGEEYAASVDDVTFVAAAPVVAGADLLRVLERAESRGWSPVVLAAPIRGARGAPPRFDLYVAAAERVERHVVDLVEGDLREVERVRSGARGVSVRNAAAVSGLVPLRTLLGGIQDFAGDSIEVVEYQRGGVNGAEAWIAMVRWQGSRRLVMLDATTGAVLDPR